MLDRVTLDQLRTFVAVAEAGSFSAAARKLRRVQSAVSTAMANLESQLEITLWDRSAKLPTLTEAGAAILGRARRVLAELDALGGLSAELAGGLEASVSVCLDAFFPLNALLDLCTDFAAAYPTVDLRIDTQVLSAVSARVLSGAASLGVVSTAGLAPGLEARSLSRVSMIPVASPQHPLASHRGRLTAQQLAESTQIVLSERQDEGVADQAVLSSRTWRVGDLHTKHAMLRAGLGWGNLPEHLIREDLRARRLARLRPAAWADDEHTLHLMLVHRPSAAFGPAHRWLIDRIATLCARETR